MKNILVLGFTLLLNNIYSQTIDKEIVPISGIILNSHDYKPLEGVVVLFDGKEVAKTDDKGYFSEKITALSNNEPISLIFQKKEFNNFKQSERVNPIFLKKGFNFIIGIRRSTDSISTAFSDTKMGALSNIKTEERLPEVIKKDHFNKGIRALRMENDKVLFEYNGESYILSESSWIKPESLDDSLIIDGKIKGKVKDINAIIKRNQIHSMTPDAKNKNVIKITTF